MQEFIPAATMSALVVVVINFLRYARGRDLDGALTIAIAWVAGVVVVAIAAQSDFAVSIEFGGRTLDTMNFASQIFAGMSLASLGSFAVDVKKAIDSSDTAVKPSLIPSTPKVDRGDPRLRQPGPDNG